MRIILLTSVKYLCCVGTQEKWQRNMNRKICPIEKKTLNLQLLSWKQSFYLKKTNTYWRYRAIACEGHRFIFLYDSHNILLQKPHAGTLSTMLALPHWHHIPPSCKAYPNVMSDTDNFWIVYCCSTLSCQITLLFPPFYRQTIISFYINPLNYNFFNHFLYFLFYFAYLCKTFHYKSRFLLTTTYIWTQLTLSFYD